jgi:hypothetical protein
MSAGQISDDYLCSAKLKRALATLNSEFPFVAMLANGTPGDISGVDRWPVQASKLSYKAMREVGETPAAKVTVSERDVRGRAGDGAPTACGRAWKAC